MEPEYIAVSKDGKSAYASLQEANAIAKLNIENCEFEYIDSCGLEDYSKVKVDIVKKNMMQKLMKILSVSECLMEFQFTKQTEKLIF